MGLNTLDRDAGLAIGAVGGVVGGAIGAYKRAQNDITKKENEKIINQLVAQSANVPTGYPVTDWLEPEAFKEISKALDDVVKESLVFNKVSLGAYYHPEKESEADFDIVWADGASHLLTVAPTRSGKGASQIIPNLLHYQGSIFTIDPKGENYQVTAKGREEGIQDCFRIDPFKLTGGTDHYNPMDFILNDDDARGMAKMMMPENPKESDFWHNEAVNLLTGLIAHIKSKQGDKATLGAVADMFTDPDFVKLVDEMSLESKSLMARDCGTVFSRKAEKERSGIMSTINQYMYIWKNEGIREATSKTDFDLADLKNAECPNFTVFLIIPFDKMVKGYAPFLRVIVNQGIDAMMRDTGKPLDNEPVLFILDEFANLGVMNDLVASLGYLAGYGARVWMFVQNYYQLKRLYGDMVDHINSETPTKSFFGNVTIETAKYISAQVGETTRSVPKTTKSISNSGEGGISMNESFEYVTQPLITPEAVMQSLGDGGFQIVIHNNRRIWATLERWYEVPELQKLGVSQY